LQQSVALDSFLLKKYDMLKLEQESDREFLIGEERTSTLGSFGSARTFPD